MKKFRFVLGLLTGILAASLLLSDFVMAEQPILIYLNGKSIQTDVMKPYLVNGRIYVPLRAFFEVLGAQVTWDNKNSVVNIELDTDLTSQTSKNQNSDLLQGNKAPNILVYLNGKSIKNVEPYIINGRVYLPVRAFCETLGAQVTWDANNSIVNIELDKDTTSKEGPDANSSLFKSKEAPNLVEAYAMIIDELYKIYPDLNHDIKYLDINTSGIVNLTDQEKTKLLKLIDDKYDLIILNKTQKELEKEGYINKYLDHGFPYEEFQEGIRINIYESPTKNSTITMTAEKYRKDFDQIGRVAFRIEYKDGNWVLTSKVIQEPKISLTQSKKAPNLVEVYAMIIDDIYKLNPGMSGDIKYLAIDTSGMANLTGQEKIKLLKIINEKYGLIILNKTIKELEEEGYIKPINHEVAVPYAKFQEGISICFTDKPIENNSIIISAYNYRGPQESMGYVHLVIEYKDGNWVITAYGPIACT